LVHGWLRTTSVVAGLHLRRDAGNCFSAFDEELAPVLRIGNPRWRTSVTENRFSNALCTPSEIEWLSDNGSDYTANDTRRCSREIGLNPLTTPVCSPQSNGMADRFVKTMKRDYVAFMPKPNAATAARNLAIAFKHYNEKHPHSALKYHAPREFRRSMDSSTLV
jgi:putative transposase